MILKLMETLHYIIKSYVIRIKILHDSKQKFFEILEGKKWLMKPHVTEPIMRVILV